MKFNIIETQHGIILRVDNTSAFVPSELTTDEMKPFAEALPATVKALHERFARNAATYRDEAIAEENSRVLDGFKPALNSAINIARSEAAAFAEADARSLEPVANFDAANEAAFIARLDAMPMPERIRATSNLTFAQSSALLRHRDLDRLGLPDDLASEVRERHRINGQVVRSGLASRYPKRATLDDPLAVGVDHAAAFAAASAAMETHRARGERVRLAADAIRSTVNYLATATGKSPDVIFASLV